MIHAMGVTTDAIRPISFNIHAVNREVDTIDLRDLPTEDETTVAADVAAHAAVIHMVVTKDVADVPRAVVRPV
eukprot:654557-Pyramimonas_sp.AAC.1